jgi:hypothetical protein
MKNHDFMQKNHIFSNFGGAGHALGAAPPPDQQYFSLMWH